MKELKYISLLVILFLLSSCAAETIRPISSGEYYGLLLKSKEFLTFCIFIASQENPYWGQVISRLYYSYFAIGRMIHIGKTNKFEKVKHDIVWSQSKADVEKAYGKNLKQLRVYYDYHPEDKTLQKKKTDEDLKFIIDNTQLFNKLVEDARTQTAKFYKHETENWIEISNLLFDEIEKEHNTLMEEIRKQTAN